MLTTSRRRGFTLPELLVALVLLGIVSTAIYQLLVNNQRLYRQQTQRIELDDNIRSAVAILPTELRELDVTDPLGSDIVDMTDSSLTYKAMRYLGWICTTQVTGSTLYMDTTRIGLRAVDGGYDSVLVFADSQTTLSSDDRWIHANVTSTGTGADCPGGTNSVRLNISPAVVASDSVMQGAPVRGFEVVDVRRYVDASGVTWLGQRKYDKTSAGWTALQPVVGPLQAKGLRFAYYAKDGTVTTDRTKVSRIQITVIGQTSQPIRLADNSMGYFVDSLITNVAPRNSR
jgi:prepilin-type N-terminal cleavage/methylation domain-containing protein